MKKALTVFLILSLSLWAVSEEDTKFEPGYIDKIHGVFSAKVREWSVSIDGAILEIYEFFGDDNCSVVSRFNASEYIIEIDPPEENVCRIDSTEGSDTTIQSVRKQPSLEEILSSTVADEFFLTRKLLEERDRSYVRVSYVKQIHSLQKEVDDISIRARLKLNRSRKRLKLFIEDFNDDNAENFGQGEQGNAPAIGVEFFSWEKFGIKPKYSLGFRGIDPFARARFSYKTAWGKWRLEPVQTFIESLDIRDSFRDTFSETTVLYMDTPTSEATLLRFVFERGTQSRVNGMHYNGSAQLYRTLKSGRGLSFNAGFNGSTKYQTTVANSTPVLIEEQNRIFNYSFSMGWRQNFLKKWLFYEINPGVNYHKEHRFRPNYNIYFRIDLFFGHV